MSWRARANWTAVAPSNTWGPAGTCSPVSESSNAAGRQIGTPPIASTMAVRPTKSTRTKPSRRTPVIDSTVFHVHAAAVPRSWLLSQPTANASLNMLAAFAGVVEPSFIVHAGRSITRSRGMEISSTRLRSAEMCATTVVSDRIPGSAPPIAAFWPLRSSDPRIRTFTAVPACTSFGAVALADGEGTWGRAPSRSVTSPASLMFESSSR